MILLPIVFVMSSALGVCWVGYTRSSAQGHAYKAGAWDMLLILISSLTTIAFVEDRWCVVANVLGGGVGTVLGMRFAKWLERKEQEQ